MMPAATSGFFSGEVDSDYYQASSAFMGRTIIKIYVEALADVTLWEKVFVQVIAELGLDIELDLSPVGNDKASDGKAMVLKQAAGAGPYLLLCVDSDFDYIAKHHRPAARLINENCYIFQTYCYALENFLCEPSAIPALLTQATKCAALNTELNFVDFYQRIGDQVYQPLLMMLFVLDQDSETEPVRARQFALYHQRFIEAISFVNQTQDCESKLAALSHDMSVLKQELEHSFANRWGHDFNQWHQGINDFFAGQWHLVVRGHDLLAKIVGPIIDKIGANRINSNYKALNQRSGADKADKIKHYNSTKREPKQLIQDRVDYEKTVIYSHIVKDVHQFFVVHHQSA